MRFEILDVSDAMETLADKMVVADKATQALKNMNQTISLVNDTMTNLSLLNDSIIDNITSGLGQANIALALTKNIAYDDVISSMTDTLSSFQKYTNSIDLPKFNNYSDLFKSIIDNITLPLNDTSSIINNFTASLTALNDTIFNVINVNPTIHQTFVDKINNVDFENIKVSEDGETIQFDNEVYNITTIDKDIESYNNELSSVKDSKDIKSILAKGNIPQKLVQIIFCAIIWGTMLQPIISEEFTDWWSEYKYQLISSIFKNKKVGYVKADSAIVRACDNSHSTCIGNVLYADEVIILDSVPRWYKIQFEDENGNVIVGYVAKRNIEYSIF